MLVWQKTHGTLILDNDTVSDGAYDDDNIGFRATKSGKSETISTQSMIKMITNRVIEVVWLVMY